MLVFLNLNGGFILWAWGFFEESLIIVCNLIFPLL